MEINVQLECHCCTSNEDVHICELDNCDYPLCSTCKEKALKIEHKCPSCRRNVIVNIENDPDTDSHEELEFDYRNSNNCINCNREFTDRISNIIYYYSTTVLLLCFVITIVIIVILAGRMVTMIFQIGPNDFWCLTLGKHHFGYFIGFGIIGALIGFCIIICVGGVLNDCLCREDNDY